MNASNHPALLPAGLRDVLPPEAEMESRSVEAIMDCFASYGYLRVKAPLLEFEESLLAGSGQAIADQIFRVMDPESQRMLGFRADTTPQIARLAISRLGSAPRPLRLAYAGQCLRVRGSHLQPERQIAQAGIELIGNDTALADAEIILCAADALAAIGLGNVSFDLTMPQLILNLLADLPETNHAALAFALDRKDQAAVAALSGPKADILLKFLTASGPAEKAIPALLAKDMPDSAKAQVVRMAETVSAIHAHNPNLMVTIDPVEFRGYQYHTGLCFTVFATGQQAELGRGGRYLCGDFEPATGITLYPDTIVKVAPPQKLRQRVYLPFGTPHAQAEASRRQNFATVAGLTPVDATEREAARLACSHYLHNGIIVAVSKECE